MCLGRSIFCCFPALACEQVEGQRLSPREPASGCICPRVQRLQVFNVRPFYHSWDNYSNSTPNRS